jgi:hypothetical protein
MWVQFWIEAHKSIKEFNTYQNQIKATQIIVDVKRNTWEQYETEAQELRSEYSTLRQNYENNDKHFKNIEYVFKNKDKWDKKRSFIQQQRELWKAYEESTTIKFDLDKIEGFLVEKDKWDKNRACETSFND